MTITINFITVINQWDPKTSYKNLCKFVSQLVFGFISASLTIPRIRVKYRLNRTVVDYTDRQNNMEET